MKLPYYTGDSMEERDPEAAAGRGMGGRNLVGSRGTGDTARHWGDEGTRPLLTQASPAQLWLSLACRKASPFPAD